MEIVLKLKLCADGKVELWHGGDVQAAPSEVWNDLQYNIISDPEIVRVPETAPSSYGYAVNKSVAGAELTKKIYTRTQASKILQFKSVNLFTEYLLLQKYIKRTGRKLNGNNYYSFDDKNSGLFYQLWPSKPFFVTQHGIEFFKRRLKIKD